MGMVVRGSGSGARIGFISIGAPPSMRITLSVSDWVHGLVVEKWGHVRLGWCEILGQKVLTRAKSAGKYGVQMQICHVEGRGKGGGQSTKFVGPH